jgi:peroxiredoxin
MAVELYVPDMEFVIRERSEKTADFEWVNRSTVEIFQNKRVVVFSLPGAFTPTCSTTHLPGFEINYSRIIDEDIDEVYCLSVNDSFVMNAWFDAQEIKNVKALPDGNGDFTRAMGMAVKKENLGFGIRSHRYAMVVDNGRVEAIWSEPNKVDNFDGDPFTISDNKTVLEYLTEVREPRREALAQIAKEQEAAEADIEAMDVPVN